MEEVPGIYGQKINPISGEYWGNENDSSFPFLPGVETFKRVEAIDIVPDLAPQCWLPLCHTQQSVVALLPVEYVEKRILREGADCHSGRTD